MTDDEAATNNVTILQDVAGGFRPSACYVTAADQPFHQHRPCRREKGRTALYLIDRNPPKTERTANDLDVLVWVTGQVTPQASNQC